MKNKLEYYDRFVNRHLGPDAGEVEKMLEVIGISSVDQLIDETVPSAIRTGKELNIPEAMSEYEYLRELKETAALNKLYRSYIGLGYAGTITPSVIGRNIFQNPAWYTQYTPYQAEIAQGRLEALLNFQTMVSDLTALPVANASLLDEATAAAEAMSMFFDVRNKRAKGDVSNIFFIDEGVYHHTRDVLLSRATPLGIELEVGNWQTFTPNDRYFGALLQYPNRQGAVEDYAAFAEKCKEANMFVTVAADLLSLCLLKPPGEWGADAVVGNTQRFGVPMGYGGPHAAFFSTKDDFKRQIPGRIIGVSIDANGDRALRMALQTREQHIRREKATSNICTAQALLAIMASMYGVYHGPKGIRAIAERIHLLTRSLEASLNALGYKTTSAHYFDTLHVEVNQEMQEKIRSIALSQEVNFHYPEGGIQISLDETVTLEDLEAIIDIFSDGVDRKADLEMRSWPDLKLPADLVRQSEYMTHPVFNMHHTETKMMRYIRSLEAKDLSLVHSMIALGSCTMKLNAASELIPVSWPEFADLHPFVPVDQAEGYRQILDELSEWLCDITGFTACSLQPNSGAQGEYTGLQVIRAYHLDRGDAHRTVALIPASAHGTNPASAVMVGMEVVVVKTDDHGNIDVQDLREKAEKHKEKLAALMVTYPSTHGVFETNIQEVCALIHQNGGLVYMDGANMNAQVGLTSPGAIHADVCHLNLHKTFAIPHGGGGPGMGPICVNDKLAPYLPGHQYVSTGGSKALPAVAAAPYGSASILLISYAYIKMMGKNGLREATKIAILNANYIKEKLEPFYPVLYVGENGRAAHELIIDLRQFKSLEVSAEDVAKRLIDYGFHAPTLSFPVAGTIMIEPTESESLDELDRFCEAMIAIRMEIDEIASGAADPQDNVLHNAPHTMQMIGTDHWNHSYSREKAAWPLPWLRQNKFWSSVARVNNAHGDRHLVCTCPPIESYQELD